MDIVGGDALKRVRSKAKKAVSDLEKIRQGEAFNFYFATGKDGAQPGQRAVNDLDAQEIV